MRIFAIHAHRVAAVSLRLVHRCVGVTHQLFGGGRVLWIQRDANRGPDVELGTGHHERTGQRPQQAVGNSHRGLLGSEPVEVVEQQQELIATLSSEQVGVTAALTEPGGDVAQQLITGRMPERVVDEFEAVEVEVQKTHGGALTLGAGKREFEVLLEQRSVRQVGERIVVREMSDLILSAATIGQVDA